MKYYIYVIMRDCNNQRLKTIELLACGWFKLEVYQQDLKNNSDLVPITFYWSNISELLTNLYGSVYFDSVYIDLFDVIDFFKY